MCLPACEASHLLCYLTVQESFTALLMSIGVRGVHTNKYRSGAKEPDGGNLYFTLFYGRV